MLLYDAQHEGRPDGTYQGGYERGELKRRSGVDGHDYQMLIVEGLAVERAYRFGDPDPDRSWGVEITPVGETLIDIGHMQNFLSSIASAQPQSEQAEWMVRTAREGLRLDA